MEQKEKITIVATKTDKITIGGNEFIIVAVDDVVGLNSVKNGRGILHEPVKHTLIDIFKELKFGRVSASQKYLEKCIKELEFINPEL